MPLEYRDDGILIGDTGTLAAITGRRPATIRAVCPREPDGYDADLCTERLIGTPDPILLTAAEADRYLGITADLIYHWVHRNQIRAVDRRGRRPLYAMDDLQRLARQVVRRPRKR